MFVTENIFTDEQNNDEYRNCKYFILFCNTYKVVGGFRTQRELEEKLDEIIKEGVRVQQYTFFWFIRKKEGIKINIALYIRVSTQEQAKEGISLATQEDLLRKYCSLYKHNIVGVYKDDGYSAKNMNRPALINLIKDIKEGQINSILVWKLSRISRNVIDLLTLLKEFEKYNVQFISYSEQFDTNSPVGKLLITVLASVAEFERETISDNVRVALNYRASLGKPTATQVLGYERSKEKLIVIPSEANLVKKIFSEYIECNNYSEVARRLNSEGYKGKRGKLFKANQIRTIIKNPLYISINRWNTKEIVSNHEKIIDEEIFRQANSKK